MSPRTGAGWSDLLSSWFDLDRDLPVLRTSFTRIMLDMLALGRQTELVPAPDTIRYLRSVITVEGLITRFAPDFDVGEYLRTGVPGGAPQRRSGVIGLRPRPWPSWRPEARRSSVWRPSAIADTLRRGDSATRIATTSAEYPRGSSDPPVGAGRHWVVPRWRCSAAAKRPWESTCSPPGWRQAIAAATMFLRTVRDKR